MINPQWLELPMSRTNFHGPKAVRAIEVRLYVFDFFYVFGEKKNNYFYLQSHHECQDYTA